MTCLTIPAIALQHGGHALRIPLYLQNLLQLVHEASAPAQALTCVCALQLGSDGGVCHHLALVLVVAPAVACKG